MQHYLQANLLQWLLPCATPRTDITATSWALFSNVSLLFSPCSALMLSFQHLGCISGLFSHAPLAVSCILSEAGSQFRCSHIHVLFCSMSPMFAHSLVSMGLQQQLHSFSNNSHSLSCLACLSLSFVALSLNFMDLSGLFSI